MVDTIVEIRFPDVEVSESRNRIESSGIVKNEQREKRKRQSWYQLSSPDSSRSGSPISSKQSTKQKENITLTV
jgi:hypothetical protein